MTRVIFAAALALQGALTAYPKVEVATMLGLKLGACAARPT